MSAEETPTAEIDPPYWREDSITQGAAYALLIRHVHGSTGVPLLPCGCVAPPGVDA